MPRIHELQISPNLTHEFKTLLQVIWDALSIEQRERLIVNLEVARTLKLTEWKRRTMEEAKRRERNRISIEQAAIVEDERCERNRVAAEDVARAEAESREKIRIVAEQAAKEEIERCERIRLQRATALAELSRAFEVDYLNASAVYQSKCVGLLSASEFWESRLDFVLDWLKKHSGKANAHLVDREQIAAIGVVDGHVQVTARAGSGKTTTLVNRAFFLMEHCGIGPDELLLLAFNRKAALEMKERLEKLSGHPVPHVMTFHALAYAIVHPEEAILMDDPEGGDGLSRVFQEIIDAHVRDPRYQSEIRAIMLAHFRTDWEQIVHGGHNRLPEDMLAFRRSLPNEGLDGGRYKSAGEKRIANFLFERGIPYRYEQNRYWKQRNYRPDFTIPTKGKSGVVVEYFGLEGDPEYDQHTCEKIEYWETQEGWTLIPVFPSRTPVEREPAFLTDRLVGAGIDCVRLSEDEIWKRIKDRAIGRFSRVVRNFITRARQACLNREGLQALVAKHTALDASEGQFLQIACRIYSAYLDRIEATGEDDFNGLLQRASSAVRQGETAFAHKGGNGNLAKIRHILVDEYQDFSELFHRLLESVRAHAPSSQLFCVGDDWQAINGFAGSDLKFFREFSALYAPATHLEIRTNYRSASQVVETGNRLMQGLGSPARSSRSEAGLVTLVDMDGFTPTPREQNAFPGESLLPAVLRILGNSLSGGRDVVCLSRTHSLPWFIRRPQVPNGPTDLELLHRTILARFPKAVRSQITVSTAHAFKGLERKTVILLDALANSYPLIHPDLRFTRVFGDDERRAIENERRLFYVGLTRSAEVLHILTAKSNPSPFLDLIRSGIKTLDWTDYPPPKGMEPALTAMVLNQRGRGTQPTLAIRDHLKAEGYTWNPTASCWQRALIEAHLDADVFFKKALWTSKADGIEVRFSDESDAIIATYRIVGGTPERLDG